MKIFVMESGFVLCGEPTVDKKDKRFYVLKRCGVIRRWGSTAGLGQLAFYGPTPSTVIDVEPDGTRIGIDAIYREIPCVTEEWAKFPTAAATA